MDIHHLHIFTSVFRFKSFTKAAQLINISQPTVSEHIKNLEIELECRLFDRVGKKIEPTSSANILFPKALKILEDVSQLKLDLLGGESSVKGEIIFGASTIPSTYILPSVIKKFQKIYPEIFFKIKIEDSQKINRRIIDNDFFCGIVGAKSNVSALHYEPFFKDHLCLISSPEIFNKKTIKQKELKEFPFLQREKGSGTRKAMEENFGPIGFSLRKRQIVAEFGSTASIKEAVIAGLGVAVVSHLAVLSEVKNRTLNAFTIDNEKMERYFYLVRHKDRTLPNSYLKFCQFLKGIQSEIEKKLYF